jgi:type II secretory pathway component PulK
VAFVNLYNRSFRPNSFRNSFRNNTRKLGKSRQQQQREILLLRQEEWSRSKFNKNFRRDVLNPDMRAAHSMRENEEASSQESPAYEENAPPKNPSLKFPPDI